FASGAITAAFFAYGAYALHHTGGLFLPTCALLAGFNAALLVRPNVSAFMRRQRMLFLLPPNISEEADERDDEDED
ncbi:MAG TPA: hypothetical protein VEQ59_19330, partial [Polyangiaceae bacterium]|nr:hypothetical protein [Polyangiaceae bacterium]